MIFSREEHAKRVNGKRGMIFTLSTDKFDVKDFPKRGWIWRKGRMREEMSWCLNITSNCCEAIKGTWKDVEDILEMNFQWLWWYWVFYRLVRKLIITVTRNVITKVPKDSHHPEKFFPSWLFFHYPFYQRLLHEIERFSHGESLLFSPQLSCDLIFSTRNGNRISFQPSIMA